MLLISDLSQVGDRLRKMRPGQKVMVHYPETLAHAAVTNKIRNEAKKEEERRRNAGTNCVFFSYKRPFLECVIHNNLFKEVK